MGIVSVRSPAQPSRQTVRQVNHNRIMPGSGTFQNIFVLESATNDLATYCSMIGAWLDEPIAEVALI